MSITEEKEIKALQVVNTKNKCLKRLREGLSCLNRDVKELFKDYVFDFDNKRLVSSCKRYAFQWQLRKYPDQPESPKNQQCTVGITLVVFLY